MFENDCYFAHILHIPHTRKNSNIGAFVSPTGNWASVGSTNSGSKTGKKKIGYKIPSKVMMRV
jgi:hypothetical protein